MNLKKTGEFIANLRKEKKLTQEQLAEKMGVSTNAVSKWERGLSFPDVSLLKKLCLEFGISIEELINGEKNKSIEATENAIISVVKTKDSVKRKLKYVIIIFIFLVLMFIIVGVIYYKNKDNELEKYYERNYQMTFVARDVEAFLKYRHNGEYPDYYGGMYISDDAYNLIVQIVKDNIPKEGTIEMYYYNELFTVDKSIKIEYVDNSYNELERVYNKINDYLLSQQSLKDFNSVRIDIYKNMVVVNYVELNEEVIKEFKENVIDSEVILFESSLENVDVIDECVNYPEEIGDEILVNHGNALISIHEGDKDYVPVVLSIYGDGTYELFTAYESCRSGRMCNMMLKYIKSVKGKYDYDIEKILEYSTNADDKSYDMTNLPKYEIYLGDKYREKYDSLMFVVEKNKKNKYLDEFLEMIDVDLSKCAKPEYKD